MILNLLRENPVAGIVIGQVAGCGHVGYAESGKRDLRESVEVWKIVRQSSQAHILDYSLALQMRINIVGVE